MRQIGEGQTLVLYLIPEVENRIQEELRGFLGPSAASSASPSGGSSGGGGGGAMVPAPGPSGGGGGGLAGLDPLLAVPAWLLLNSMRTESLQFVMLSTQELRNIWRKNALGRLLAEAVRRGAERPHREDPLRRLSRFADADKEEAAQAAQASPAAAAPSLRACVELFREPLGVLHDLAPSVPRVTFFADKVGAAWRVLGSRRPLPMRLVFWLPPPACCGGPKGG